MPSRRTASSAERTSAKTPEEIVQLLDRHERWLRKAPGGIRADLTLQVLSGANLSRIVLRGAKLAGCDLSNARLVSADLSECDLFSANLSNADLTNANLKRADMRGINLRAANLTGARLDRADLRTGTLLGPAQDGAVSFVGSVTGKVDLQASCMKRADLTGAR